MTTPIQGKTGEEIVREFNERDFYDTDGYLMTVHDKNAAEWLRSSMRSLIQRMVDELPKKVNAGENGEPICDVYSLTNEGYNTAISDCLAILIRERDSI